MTNIVFFTWYNFCFNGALVWERKQLRSFICYSFKLLHFFFPFAHSSNDNLHLIKIIPVETVRQLFIIIKQHVGWTQETKISFFRALKVPKIKLGNETVRFFIFMESPFHYQSFCSNVIPVQETRKAWRKSWRQLTKVLLCYEDKVIKVAKKALMADAVR